MVWVTSKQQSVPLSHFSAYLFTSGFVCFRLLCKQCFPNLLHFHYFSFLILMDGAYENKNTFQLNYHLKVNVSRIFLHLMSVLRLSEQFSTCLHLLKLPVSEGEKLSRQRTVYSDVFKTDINETSKNCIFLFSAFGGKVTSVDVTQQMRNESSSFFEENV